MSDLEEAKRLLGEALEKLECYAEGDRGYGASLKITEALSLLEKVEEARRPPKAVHFYPDVKEDEHGFPLEPPAEEPDSITDASDCMIETIMRRTPPEVHWREPEKEGE